MGKEIADYFENGSDECSPERVGDFCENERDVFLPEDWTPYSSQGSYEA
ncbi:hypothetical protein HNV12_00400 [Methanococcoides sp. SA1]|nr:hypothetical protein [Methanococcoides sp. SA1]